MAQRANAMTTALKGTAIALVTWLVLYLTKEHLGRTSALVLAAVIFLFFVFVVWSRMRVRAGQGSGPPSD